VLVNFGASEARIDLDAPATVEVSSTGRSEGAAFDGELGPEQGVWLRVER
jgi:hypothetical protein